MSDLISRKLTLKNIEKIRQSVQMMDDTHRASITMNGMYLCEKAVRNQPSAQPERTGKWIDDVAYYDEDGCPCMVTRCNQCGEVSPVSNYCPNCGARMTGGDAQ